jgi:hypothetical protein
MNINLLPFTVLWMLFSTAVLGLILYRAWIARNEDERLHVHQSEAGVVSQQAATAQKLEAHRPLGTSSHVNRASVRTGCGRRLPLPELVRKFERVSEVKE